MRCGPEVKLEHFCSGIDFRKGDVNTLFKAGIGKKITKIESERVNQLEGEETKRGGGE